MSLRERRCAICAGQRGIAPEARTASDPAVVEVTTTRTERELEAHPPAPGMVKPEGQKEEKFSTEVTVADYPSGTDTAGNGKCLDGTGHFRTLREFTDRLTDRIIWRLTDHIPAVTGCVLFPDAGCCFGRSFRGVFALRYSRNTGVCYFRLRTRTS